LTIFDAFDVELLHFTAKNCYIYGVQGSIMTSSTVIKSITLIVVSSLFMAWLGQYLMYHYHIADAMCQTSDCQQATKDSIIGTIFLIIFFSLSYFVFIVPSLAKNPGMELSILLSCLIVNFIQFESVNAFLCLIPYNVLSVYYYHRIKKQLNKPFKLYPFILQEMFLLILLLSTYVYLDELFVSKGYDRDTVLPTGAEKMLDRIFSFSVWTVFILHVLWLVFGLVKRKGILRPASS
jgi:hypothetical protein